jgi:uncharacterized membrane protein
MWQKLSKYFFNGLITLLPLFITIYLVRFLFNFIDGVTADIITVIAGRPLPGVGFITTVLFILFVGYLAPYIVGRQLIAWAEYVLVHVPVVKSIYSSAKQVNDVLFQQKEKASFRRACLVEYPRKGIYSVGFVTSDAAQEITQKTGKKMLNVFIANTPTPATGFTICVSEDEIIWLDMKLDEAFKYVVSGGVLNPENKGHDN